MANFKKIPAEQITENPFKLIGSDWALVSCGEPDFFNTMTVSWGGVGIMWGKPSAFTFIRPQRHTYNFMAKYDFYTICFFDEKYRKALQFCGTKSGRHYDKVKATELTTVYTEDGAPYFEEAKLVLVCKKSYSQFLTEDNFIDESTVSEWYEQKDFHKMFIGEIQSVLIAE